MSLDHLRGHQFFPEEIKAALPPLYSQDGMGLQALALVKFFTPRSNWTWYASEGSPVDEDGYYDTDKPKVDVIFFGLVSGFEIELGNFSLNELESVRDRLRLPAVERDLYFRPMTLAALQAIHVRRE